MWWPMPKHAIYASSLKQMNVLQPPNPLLDSWILHFPHLWNSPPLSFSLRKACQRESSQVEDIVERLWQAESHSNGSIMSLIMVWVSIIYQSWGLADTESREWWLQWWLAGDDELSFPMIRQGWSRRWTSSKPTSLSEGWALGAVPWPDLLIMEHWTGKSHMTGCFHGASAGSAVSLRALK